MKKSLPKTIISGSGFSEVFGKNLEVKPSTIAVDITVERLYLSLNMEDQLRSIQTIDQCKATSEQNIISEPQESSR